MYHVPSAGAEKFFAALIGISVYDRLVRKVVMELHLLGKTNDRASRRDISKAMPTEFERLGFTCTRQPVIKEKNWTAMATFERGA